MTDLKDRLARLFDDEPPAPYDVEDIVRSGRRARRRRQAVLAVAGTAGAAGLTAAVVVPVLATGGGDEASVTLGSQPSVTAPPTKATGQCFIGFAPNAKAWKRELSRLIRSGKVGDNPTITTIKTGKKGVSRAVCTHGTTPADLQQQDQSQDSQGPTGPRFHYTEEPAAISSRLGTHLHDRVSGFGLSITYTRPFSQESSNLDSGRPSYFGGNVDVRESKGYGDIGVQVQHVVSVFVPFTGDCTAADHCAETTLPDGSVLRTGQVEAGAGDLVLTAEVHRPDGVVVQAQESNYPFGPDAGSQPHGEQPLTLAQLESLAKDAAFTF